MTTREERMDVATHAVRRDDGNNCISRRGICRDHAGCICRSVATAAYDALVAMGVVVGAPSGEGWSPIASAPKDREIILAGRWFSARWEVKVGQWLVSRWPFVGEGQPSHWMP